MLKYFLKIFFGLLLFAASAESKPIINYTISCLEPHSHYFKVEMELEGFKEKTVQIKMPVWIPGSYMVREFSKNIETLVAKDGSGKSLNVEKSDKNTWKVTLGSGKTTISYAVYAYELSVRASYLDIDHAFINGTSTLLYVDKWQQLPSTVKIIPQENWKKAATSLANLPNETWIFKAENYDEIADSPIEVGNHETISFDVNGVPHSMAIFGTKDFDKVELANDLKAICTEASKVVGELPCKNYTFILHCIPNAGGGLEHKNSSVLQTSRTNLVNEPGYSGFLNLVAHEYFHLWNVKRIRPKALGPFDYNAENYTHLLWLSEGFTSYYDDYLLLRAGKTEASKFLESISGSINYNENTPGSQFQSLAEASQDAWIKYYRPNENSANATISYYNKGAMIAALMDLHIIYQTKGEKCLDDVFKLLYEEYFKKQDRGFTDEELQRAFETVGGLPLDSFFTKHINGTTPPDYSNYLGYAGLKLVNLNEGKTEPWLGINISPANGKTTVSSVVRNSPAWKQGIYVNDEIIAINNFRVNGEVSSFLMDKKPGDFLDIILSRDGILRSTKITLSKNELTNFRLTKVANPTEQQKFIYKKWLKTDF